MILTILVTCLVILACIKIRKTYNYWNEKEVRYIKPWPFFGFMGPCVFRLKSFSQLLKDMYNVFPEQRYFGCYQFLTPTLIVRDQELIEEILIKHFDTFPEHRLMIDSECDPLWSKNLFAMRGEEWLEMRTTLGPMFDGAQLGQMFALIKESAQNFGRAHESAEESLVELKDLTTKYASDVIASVAFGLACDSFADPNAPFHVTSKEMTKFTLPKMLKFFGYTISPRIMKYFKFKVFDQRTSNFYRKLARETLELREDKGVARADAVAFLVDARKKSPQKDVVNGCSFTIVEDADALEEQKEKRMRVAEDDVTAQGVLFLFAGFETTYLALSYLIYELALNPKIQEKLSREVEEVRKKFGDDVAHEALLEMKYLDMVVSETLRKWPPTILSSRKSAKAFKITSRKSWEKELEIDVGTICLIPILAIHRDAKNYPNPDAFDPERFDEENVTKIKPFTYLPFGAGPRSCIGLNFAILEIKTFVYYLLSDFEVVSVEQTADPLVLSKRTFQPVPDSGFWVGFKHRPTKTV